MGKPEPLYAAEIDFLLFENEKRPVRFQLFIWRNLQELRLANGFKAREKVYALCLQSTSPVFAALHYAATSLQADLIAHEILHAADQLERNLGLEHDEHDEETRAEITGLMSHLVMGELEKFWSNTKS